MVELKFNNSLKRFLTETTLVCLVSPTGVGKDTLINEVIKLRPQKFHAVKILTSRPKRGWESEDDYFFIKDQRDLFLRSKLQAGEVVNLTINPSNSNIYGTIRDSFAANKLNLMPTLASSLPEIHRIPFGKIITISLSCSFEDWLDRVGDRVKSPDFKGRIKEGILSLRLSLKEQDRIWILNDDLSLASEELADFLLNSKHPSRSKEAKSEALSLATELSKLI